ncbi:MAG TPA: hypothetical protein VGP13_01985 [Candidatus Paceibacterota bacterium]|jgi:hypothetical protein|nr:hypothetical protein [Candidatus Paceibacterota bacterium]
MIIEFCGVPGGGKSTAVAAYLSAHPEALLITVDMRRRLPEAWYALIFTLRHPVSFISLVAFVARHHMSGLGAYSLHLALRACAKYGKASCYSTKTELVIDEGLVHAAMTLSAKPLSSNEVSALLSRLILPSRAVVASEGSFHRFHGPRDVVHPRALAGDEALQTWESAVRANVTVVSRHLPAFGVKVEGVARVVR